ncbi:MAG TPA: hypothetical protein VIT67_06910 [Povalibacter sp.]
MSDADNMLSNIDLPASPYTVIAFGAGDGRVVTFQGTMSLDAAAQLMIATLEDFDWPALETHGTDNLDGLTGYDEMLDIVSLVAEINLYLSRLLWSIKVPSGVGLPRMLERRHEAEELRYLKNLATQRALADDELALHLLEHGAFMSQWGEARRWLVAEQA